MKRTTKTIYRDSVTGRFARKSTWTRSQAQGGTRYKRQHVPIKAPPKPPPEPIKLMWRVTIGIPWVITKKKTTTYSSYKVEAWFSSKPSDTIIKQLKERCFSGLEKLTGYDRKDWWFTRKANIEVETMPRDDRLIGVKRTTEKNEITH